MDVNMSVTNQIVLWRL